MRFFNCILCLLVFTINLSGQENTALLCTDGLDNDNDGFTDCEDSECASFISQACDICSEGISFADYVIDYRSGCSISDPFPEGALGLADYLGQPTDQPEFVFLGNTGSIKLGFSNNLVTNSGDNQLDIWVFEVGGLVEAITIGLRPKGDESIQLLEDNNFSDPDGDGFYEMLDIGGALSGIDIDDLIPGQLPETILFDAIQITDIEDVGCIGSAPGADIDAVCAIFYVETDCNCIPNGTSIVDDCGNCLEPTDPEFNMECMDCNGTLDGTAVIDDCGVCLELTDPEFNQSCVDCNGTLNGLAVIDLCGNCLDPTDPDFNMGCVDCNGTLGGTAVIDDCGVCLDPTDVNFNMSCLDCNGVINGLAIMDDCGICLEPTDPDFNQSCIDCNGVPNGLAEIDLCGNCLEPTDPEFNITCVDCNGTLDGIAVIDDCGVCLEPTDATFNMTCLDCNGEINGLSIIDDCGICLDPMSIDFNQSCFDCAGVLNGESVVDDCGECSDLLSFNQTCADCEGTPNGLAQIDDCGNCLEPTDPNFILICNPEKAIYIPNVIALGAPPNDEFQIFINDPTQIVSIPVFAIYDRWGNKVYQVSINEFSSFSDWWDGTKDNKALTPGCYVYKIQVLFADNSLETYVGDVTLLK